MIDDRLKAHPLLYILGITCLLISICLFGFSLYIFPFLFFGFKYSVPEIITRAQHWHATHQELEGILLVIAIYIPFLISSLLFAFIALLFGNRIERELLEIKQKAATQAKPEVIPPSRSSILYSLKLFLLMVLIILGLITIEYLINVDMLIHMLE